MENRSLFRNAVDFYRTAPFAETVFLINVVLAYTYSDFIVTSGFYSINALTSIYLATERFSARYRLEETLQKYGFDERLFAPGLNEWCTRQTDYVAADRQGYGEEYLQFVNKNRRNLPGSALPMIPHF